MKIMKFLFVMLLSVISLSANAQWHRAYYGHPYYAHPVYHHYPVGYGYHYSRFGFVPWVVGGAFLFGSIVVPSTQVVYVSNGVMYQRVDTYCVDQYGNQVICGYQWIQQ
jgi:hypothetical protein